LCAPPHNTDPNFARWRVTLIFEPDPQAMIDIHSHILWGVDDGAATLAQSLDMLRMAADSGTTDIVATPHANFEYPFDPAVLTSRYEELALHHTGLPRVHRGCDFHLSAGNIQDALDHPAKYTVNGGRYLMVELPEMFSPASIDHALWQLSSKGMLPVVTHPERNPVLQRSPEILQRWVDRGCLSQVTAQSLTGRFGRRAKVAAWQFLRAGNIHFAASDAHDTTHRPPTLDHTRDLLAKEIGKFLARCLTIDFPQAVIENSESPMEIEIEPGRRKWYQWWRR
jgi:protein-tyrosine phosphatase